MSGFEVVGLILGSVPLLISALEHYSDGVSTIKQMNDYETVFETLQTSFVTSLSIYRNSCEELLSPLMLPDKELSELLKNRSAKSWEGEKLGESLRERLGPSYIPYKASVKQLYKKINLFAKKLKLGNDMRPPWIMDNDTVDEKLRVKFFKNPWTRIKGGFEAEKYAKLLAEITSDIDRIATLTKGAIALDLPRLEQKRLANATHYWINIRNHARRLFETFNSQWSCTCSCNHPHRVSLRLDMREDCNIETRFGFKLSFDLDTAEASALPWYWRDVEIEPLSTSSRTATLNAYGQPLTQGSVQIATNPTITLSPSSASRPPPRIPSSQILRIANLCEVLKQKTQPRCCLGFLDNHHPWQDHIYSVTPPSLHKDSIEPATLAEIVHQGNDTILGTREKCTVALTLASAVLQLHDTPWLSKSWNIKDILFIKNSTKASSPLGQPYVSKIFTPTTKSQKSAIPNSRRFTKNEMVFGLGIALLELSYGKPISWFKTADDLDDQGNETIYTEYFIASRLTEAIDKRELSKYAKAALRCVTCNFDTFTYSLDDSDFRERFYQGVILPLQQDYKYATSTSASLQKFS